jgi:3-oxoacyl-[acyl-carrier-protein] synthase II
VWITGVGVVSPLAVGAQPHFARLLQGESGIQVAANGAFSGYGAGLEARVLDFDRATLITNRMLRKLLSLAAAYAVAAAGEAIQDAGLGDASETLARCGLYVGSIAIDINPELFIPAFKQSLNAQGEFAMSQFARRGIKLLDPLFLVKALPNAGVCGISVQYQVLGANANITNGPVSGLQAVALAAAAIRRGEIDLAVAGGYDSLLRMDSRAEHFLAGRLADGSGDPASTCRPFDTTRRGYVVGEGAAFVMLEAAAHAQARGAGGYAELLGVGQATDATAFAYRVADGGALEQAARQALQTGMLPTAIFGDGLATAEDDAREAGVARRLAIDGAPFGAATPAVGFTGAASGAFSLAHAALALRHSVIPPLVCREPDPACAVTCLAQAQATRLDRALVWTSDRGVKNVAVLLGQTG